MHAHKSKPLPSYEYLHACYRLDSETGFLFWKKRPRRVPVGKGISKRCCNVAGKRADGPLRNGYRRVRIIIDGKYSDFAAHRIIFKMVHGFDPAGDIDHIDRNRSNNRPDNLRVVTHQENMKNKGADTRVRSPLRGVYPTRNEKFRAQIRARGKIHYLGTFRTAAEARFAVAKFDAFAGIATAEAA